MFLIVLLCLTACDTRSGGSTEATLQDTLSEPAGTAAAEGSTTEERTETAETLPEESSQLPLPEDSVEFSFLSGAGGWRTVMTLNRNGTFTGLYLDSEMGDVGEGYPYGSVYICNFSGRFTTIEKADGYSYKMTLTDIRTEKTVGEEWIEDEIRYVASAPHGLNDPYGEQECSEFVFFLPDTPVAQLSEAFLSWWPYRYTQETDPKTTLSCYGILNVTANFGFFTSE